MKRIRSGQALVTQIIGAPPNLIGVIGYRIREQDTGDVVVAKRTTGIEEDPPGSGYYIGTSDPLILPVGLYEALWDTDAAGIITPANSSSQFFEVIEATTVIVDPLPDPLTNSPLCSLWITAGEVAALPGVTASPEEAAEAAQMASEILFELSGEQYTGECESTVTPWSAECWHEWGHGWQGIILPGGPVESILEVSVLGDVLDPAYYWLDGVILYGAPQGNGVTITYRHGQPPPLAGRKAALIFAGELTKGASGGFCRVPENVTQISRQGVTYSKRAAAEVRDAGGVGVALVDLFIRTYNPHGVPSGPSIWSPGMTTPRRVP